MTTTLHRRACCIAMLAFALTAGCGDDEKPSTTNTNGGPTTTLPNPTTTISPPTTASGLTTTSTPIPNATDGATCPTVGVRGVGQGGLALVCTQIAGGNELRWRPA
jgi:hypothetical protein